MYKDVTIVYADTGSEHPDNVRFMKDCEDWFGQKVDVVRSEEFSNIYEVFEKRKMLVTHFGAAPCTAALKKIPCKSVLRDGDIEIFGYTVEEKKRVERWKKDNFERDIECPLIDRQLTKDDCFGILDRIGIELPEMYRLGFRNNNCIGCVKARDNLNYWKRVRKFFPYQFERTAKLERELGMYINRISKNGQREPIYLDEIEPGDPDGVDPNIQCGLFCMSEADNLKQNDQVLASEGLPATPCSLPNDQKTLNAENE